MAHPKIYIIYLNFGEGRGRWVESMSPERREEMVPLGYESIDSFSKGEKHTHTIN